MRKRRAGKKSRPERLRAGAAALAAALALGLSGCAGTDIQANHAANSVVQAGSHKRAESVAQAGSASQADLSGAPAVPGLTCTSSMPLTYATGFHVYYYTEGFKVIDVPKSGQYLVVPAGQAAPQDLPAGMQVLQQPLAHIYLAASSVMSLFEAMGASNAVTLTGTNASGWTREAPKAALASGAMRYAGKYSEPDYEMLLAEHCDLALESTMILHAPEVQEMLEDLGIPVFTDRSAYEKHPLGRTEWIKAYAAMLNKEDEAAAFFDGKSRVMEELSGFPRTDKTVAYFSVNTSGQVVIRAENDYIPAMIDIAGGRYVTSPAAKKTEGQTVDLSTEEFYRIAAHADYLVYNAAIVEELNSTEDLLSKDVIFGSFDAVKNGRLWQVDKTAYQSTDAIADMIRDFHWMLTDGDTSHMRFLHPVPTQRRAGQ